MAGAQKSAASSQGPFCIWQGLDFPSWMKLVAQRPKFHWSQSLRWGLLTAFSLNNSLWRGIEQVVYGGKIRRTELPAAPVFILGHWRSGTTLLHNLLSNDPQFSCPNMYQVLFPHHFLLSERLITWLTGPLLPKTRPMDNMEVSWNAPQEDEVALAILTLCSPYMMLAFQGERSKYENSFDFAGLSPSELEQWKSKFTLFLKKVTIRNGGRRLLLKSPTHTFRVRVLRELFPGAKFIHIVRNPYAVYSSSMHLRRTLFEANTLSRPNFEGLEEDMLLTYNECFRTYERDRALLGEHELHEMRFEDLERDPLGELSKTYQQLQLKGFGDVEAAITPQLDSLRRYRKNKFEMEEELKRKIYDQWKPVFDRYGYDADLPVQPRVASQVA
ncbi:MAG TPA: sulfotransferase [Planctomycetaceae bacterium]|nr:sulfotransferase [Planctomycetaceae bacterium]